MLKMALSGSWRREIFSSANVIELSIGFSSFKENILKRPILIITLGVITLVSETANFLGNINVYFEKMHNTSQNLISKFDFRKIQLS